MNHLIVSGALTNATRDQDGSVKGTLTFHFPKWDKALQREVPSPATVDVFLSQRVMQLVELTGKKVSTEGMTLLVEGNFDISKAQGSPEQYLLYASNVTPLGVGVECHVNTILLAGNIGQDPEIKYFESGQQQAKFSLATKKNVKDADKPDWHSVQAIGKSAEFVGAHLPKGSTVSVRGVLVEEAWSDKSTGAPRRKFVVKLDRINPLGKKDANSNGGGNQYATAGATSAPAPYDPLDDF